MMNIHNFAYFNSDITHDNTISKVQIAHFILLLLVLLLDPGEDLRHVRLQHHAPYAKLGKNPVDLIALS